MSERDIAGNVKSLLGIPVVEASALPLVPSTGTWARRYVRHGMADVLAWLGEEVGPEPDAVTHALLVGNTLHASAAIVGRLRDYMPSSADTTEAGR